MNASATTQPSSNSRNAFLAGFLGWTFDAFDFFILTYVLGALAKDFHKPVSSIVLMLTASLVMRPVGAIFFGLLGDRYGRRRPLMFNILFNSCIEVLSGLAPSYGVLLVCACCLASAWAESGDWALLSPWSRCRRKSAASFQEFCRRVMPSVICSLRWRSGRSFRAGAGAHVFPEHRAGFAHRVLVVPRGGKQGLEGRRLVEERLGSLFRHDRRQWKAFALSWRADVHDGFPLAWQPGPLPDLPPAADSLPARR